MATQLHEGSLPPPTPVDILHIHPLSLSRPVSKLHPSSHFLIAILIQTYPEPVVTSQSLSVCLDPHHRRLNNVMSGEYLNDEATVADGFLVHFMTLSTYRPPLSSHAFSFQNINPHKHTNSHSTHFALEDGGSMHLQIPLHIHIM